MRPWDLAGPLTTGGESPGLSEALRFHHTAERRKPVEADVPKLSTLPMTRAAREALRISRERA